MSNFIQGNKFKQEGKLDDAMASYQRAITEEPSFYWSHYNLGEVLAKLGKLDEAIDSYRRAVDINGQSFLAHYKLGETLYNRINQNPESFWHQYYSGKSLATNLDTIDDEEFLDATEELSDADFLEKLYRIYLHREADQGGKLNYLQKIKNEDLERQEIINGLRNAPEFRNRLYKSASMPEVITCCKNAIELSENHYLSYYLLAESLKAQGNFPEAIETYHKITEIKPDFNVESKIDLLNLLLSEIEETFRPKKRNKSFSGSSPKSFGNLPKTNDNSLKTFAPTWQGAISEEPTLTNPVSQVVTESQLRSYAYHYWCEEIHHPPVFHRKIWEYAYILQSLAELGMLAPEKKGLGFGVGKEPLVSVMASRGCYIVATDQDSNSAHQQGWSSSNQYAENLTALNELGICPPERFTKLVKYQVVDMNKIDAKLEGFDYIWSACAFEHLGSIKNGFDFVIKSLNCLKPGGIAVHTTEFNVSSNEDTVDNEMTVLFRRRDIEKLAEKLVKMGHKIVVNYNTGNGELDRHIDTPPWSDPHLKVQMEKYVTTSIGIIIQKSL